MKEIKRVSIVGMGAMGIMYGEFFGERLGWDKVTFLGDEERVRRFAGRRITCNGKVCPFRMEDASLPGEPAGLLIFAVKATGLEEAVRQVKGRVDEDTVILSVLNGISSEEIIEAQLGAGTVIHCVAKGMDAVKLGDALTYTHLGTLCLGIPKGDGRREEKLAALKRVVDLFWRNGLPHEFEPDILHTLYCKWMMNVGINQTIMVEEGTYRTVQQPGPAREMMKAAMAEVMAVAQAEGVDVTQEDLDEYVALADTLNPDGMPSMRQDGLAGRPTEVELFAGTVIRKAKRLGVEVPVNEELYRRIKGMERKRAE